MKLNSRNPQNKEYRLLVRKYYSPKILYPDKWVSFKCENTRKTTLRAGFQSSLYSFACPKKTPKAMSRWLTNEAKQEINNGEIIV